MLRVCPALALCVITASSLFLSTFSPPYHSTTADATDNWKLSHALEFIEETGSSDIRDISQSDFCSSPFYPSRLTEPIVSRKALCASAEPTPYHTASQRVQTTISWQFLGLRVAMFQCGYKIPLAVWIDKCSVRCNFPPVHKTEWIFIVRCDEELGHQRWLWCRLCWLSGTCWSLPEPWLLWAL